MILGNKNRHLEGSRVMHVEDGRTGVITEVVSHGNNPWTRYNVRWDDGSVSYSIVPSKTVPTQEGGV